MQIPQFILFVEADGTWRIGIHREAAVQILQADVPDSATPEQAAARLQEVLQTAGYQGQGVILAVPAAWCLSALVSAADLPRGDMHQTLLYRLEDCLPLAAEEVVADFLVQGDDAFGVCISTATVLPWVQALEAHGIAVQCITPTTILALQSRMSSDPEPAYDAVLWSHQRQLNLFLVPDGRLKAWHALPADDADLTLPLQLHGLHRSAPWRLLVLQAGQNLLTNDASLAQLVPVPEGPTSMLDAATGMIPEILSGRAVPWIDFRRDALATQDHWRLIRPALRLAYVAVLALLLCLTIAMQWRSWQYTRLTEAHRARQQAVYRQLFPGQPIPAGVKVRLLSEQRRLSGISGEAANTAMPTSALTLVYEAMRRLPTDVRYRLMDLRFADDKVYLEGQAASHGDANAVAAALRKQQGFQVEPPRSEQMGDKGVAFTLAAVLPSSPTTRRSVP